MLIPSCPRQNTKCARVLTRRRLSLLQAAASDNVLLLVGGTTDYGTRELADLVHVSFSERGSTSSPEFHMNATWVSDSQPGGPGIRSHGGASLLGGGTLLLFGGVQRVWKATPLSLDTNQAHRLELSPCAPSDANTTQVMNAPPLCAGCSAGFVTTAQGGSWVCTPCRAGSFERHSVCVGCPVGFYGSEQAATQAMCAPCTAGKYYGGAGGTACAACDTPERCPIASTRLNYSTVVSSSLSTVCLLPFPLLDQTRKNLPAFNAVDCG